MPFAIRALRRLNRQVNLHDEDVIYLIKKTGHIYDPSKTMHDQQHEKTPKKKNYRTFHFVQIQICSEKSHG